jgi:hypothetical protein
MDAIDSLRVFSMAVKNPETALSPWKDCSPTIMFIRGTRTEMPKPSAMLANKMAKTVTTL